MENYARSLVYRAGQAPLEIPLDDVSEHVDVPENFLWIDIQSPSSVSLA